MVPKGKEKALMTFDQVVARVKAIPGVGGCLVGEKWEGYTDNQLRVDVFAKKGSPGVTVLWEYHDGEHRHQCGKHSVGRADIDQVVADVTAAAAMAVPGRYVQEVEARTAAERDPALAEAARVRGDSEEDVDFDPPMRDVFGSVDHARRVEPVVPNGFVEPTEPTEPVEDETDPALAEAARVQAEGPVEIDVEEGPPPDEEQTGDDQDVEGQEDNG